MSAFLSGFLAAKYGGRTVLAGGHFLMAFSSVMSPIAAGVQPGFLMFMQMLVGIGAVSILQLKLTLTLLTVFSISSDSDIHEVLFPGVFWLF